MAQRVLTETAASIPGYNKTLMATVAAGEGMAVAVLTRNEPAFSRTTTLATGESSQMRLLC